MQRICYACNLPASSNLRTECKIPGNDCCFCRFNHSAASSGKRQCNGQAPQLGGGSELGAGHAWPKNAVMAACRAARIFSSVARTMPVKPAVQAAASGADAWTCFSTTWQASTSGRLTLRAALLPATNRARTATPSGPPATAPVSVIVYRDAVATIYGPGFWGHRTAFGQTLEPSMLGVASIRERHSSLRAYSGASAS